MTNSGRAITLTLAVAATLATLAGCSAPAAKPTPTATVSSNAGPCKSLQTTTALMADKLNTGDSLKDAWDGIRAEFDDAGLRAHGDVKTRIQSLVSAWPDVTIFVTHKYDTVNNAIDDIGRACAADGVDVQLQTFAN